MESPQAQSVSTLTHDTATEQIGHRGRPAVALATTWNDTHPLTKALTTGSCRCQRALAGAIGTGGYQRHANPMTQVSQRGIIVMAQSHPVPPPVGSSAQQSRQTRMRRNQPGMRARPSGTTTFAQICTTCFHKRPQALLLIRHHDHAFSGRTSLQAQQSTQGPPVPRITPQTKYRAGGIGHHAPLLQKSS